MTWKNEKQRHQLAARGISTKNNISQEVKDSIKEWDKFNVERNLYMIKKEIPIGSIIYINNIEYEIEDYFLGDHKVPIVSMLMNKPGKNREWHSMHISMMWDNFINYSSINKEDKLKAWKQLEEYKKQYGD